MSLVSRLMLVLFFRLLTQSDLSTGEFGASYVPLQWSPQLARDAKRWATKLLDDCDVSGIEHEKASIIA